MKTIVFISKFNTKVAEIRSQRSNVLLLDGGDRFVGTLWFTQYKGLADSFFINRYPYDAMVSVSPFQKPVVSHRQLMRGSMNFRRGGGGGVQVNLTKMLLQRCFLILVLILFYRSQMVNFKENYHFSRFRRGPTFSGGGGGPTFSMGGPIAYSLQKPI